ncbi:phage portal protein [Paenibacillus ginsengarvi]|uniref:Phage portal protein n=1 Tax=Paenibacillus ginsengarvi TaxID=400777 RepID=A0A3B0CS29_9BACL|nr:phage portal protein [Paenibacillus ginsengarvi]RKN86751.1 phage portal protein [Paenibacillus ginsengarvi]
MRGGKSTLSGVHVNDETAMRVTAYWAAVKIIAETIASLPLNVYQAKGDERVRAPNHPLYEVLHFQANPEMPAYTFRETFQGHICNWGNGYSFIDRNGAGQVSALWPLLPDRTRPDRDEQGNLIYWTLLPKTNEPRRLDAFDVLHIPGFGFDGVVGYNPIKLAQEAIGLSIASEEFGAAFFGNGATPSGVIEYPAALSDKALENYKKEARSAYQGLSNAHKLMILEEGLKYHQVTIPPDAAQFLETRKFQIAEIARIFRVPLHMLQELDRATNNNIEHQSIEFVVHTIRPWLVRWEQYLRMKLLSQRERRLGFYAEFNVEGLLRGDTKSRFEAYGVALDKGWMSPNEVRRKENENPYPGGDAYRVPLNTAKVNPDGSTSTEEVKQGNEQTTE